MKKRLMVVDDSRVVGLKMQKLLEGTEFEVAGYCQNGEEAIARYDDIRPDLVTMDILMPGLDGLETAGVILNEHPGARIIMISSLAYDDTVKEAEEIGVKAFVYKPLDKEMLVDVLKTVLTEA